MSKKRTVRKPKTVEVVTEAVKIPEITSLRLGDLRPELEREAQRQTRTLTSLVKHYLKRGLESERPNGADAA